jgi:hypothetical protein
MLTVRVTLKDDPEEIGRLNDETMPGKSPDGFEVNLKESM